MSHLLVADELTCVHAAALGHVWSWNLSEPRNASPAPEIESTMGVRSRVMMPMMLAVQT
jgi:hypothetical protein